MQKHTRVHYVQVNRGIADMSMKQTFQNFLKALPENDRREKQVEWIFKVHHPPPPHSLTHPLMHCHASIRSRSKDLPQHMHARTGY